MTKKKVAKNWPIISCRLSCKIGMDYLDGKKRTKVGSIITNEEIGASMYCVLRAIDDLARAIEELKKGNK